MAKGDKEWDRQHLCWKPSETPQKEWNSRYLCWDYRAEAEKESSHYPRTHETKEDRRRRR